MAKHAAKVTIVTDVNRHDREKLIVFDGCCHGVAKGYRPYTALIAAAACLLLSSTLLLRFFFVSSL